MTKVAKSVVALVVGVLAVANAPAAHAMPIVVHHAVSVNAVDPGLVVHTLDIASNPYVDNLTLGVPVTLDLFRIWTNETAVSLGEDNIFKPAVVLWTFLSPLGGGLTTGFTHGTTFFGLFDSAEVLWGGPTVVDFANGAQIMIWLSNAQFNAASLSTLFFDLTPGIAYGANVEATLLMTRPPLGSPVPEPAIVTLLMLGLPWVARRSWRR